MENKKALMIGAGILFLLAMFTGIGSVLFSGFASSAFFSLRIQAFLEWVMAFSCTGIAVCLYPILKEFRPAMALGALVFRGFEGILHSLSALAPLMFIGMSGMENALEAAEILSNLGLIAFALGAFMYYWIFAHTSWVPKWIAWWGMIAICLTFISQILVFFGWLDKMTLWDFLMNFPIALNELVLAFWLIINGIKNRVPQ